MKMPGMTIKHASAMPAPTWSWLKMNDVKIEIPDGLERNCQVEIDAGDALDNAASFEGSVASLQERMDARASADPWDNTLAYAYADDVFHGYLYALPAGMGIEFDWNTYIADPEETIYSRYAMVNHGTDAEARLLADGWQPLISTEDLIVYERPDTQ